MWKKSEITARFCSMSALTLIYNRLYDRLDRGQPEDQGGFRRSFKRWIILQHTDCLNENARRYFNKAQVSMASSLKMRYRTTTHLFVEEAIRGTEREQGKWHFRGTKGSEAGRPIVQFALQHSTPNGTERRRDTVAKDKRHGQMLRWFCVWLPHKPVFYWRRAPLRHIAGAASKKVVRHEAEFREGGFENQPGQDENSQELKFKQKKEKSRWTKHWSWDVNLLAKVQNILGKQLFQEHEKAEIKNRTRAEWGSRCKYKQELTSKLYFLQHRLRLSSVVITGADLRPCTCTLSSEYERMIRSTQRKMLCLIVQMKIDYQKKTRSSKNEKDEEGEIDNYRRSDEEIIEGSSSNTDCGQDSDVSFTNDTDEVIDELNGGRTRQQNGTSASDTDTRHTDQWEHLSTTPSNLRKLKRWTVTRGRWKAGLQCSSQSIWWQSAKQKILSSSSCAQPREIGWQIDDEHCVATHQGADWFWL